MTASILVTLTGTYLVLGCVFAIWFVCIGVDRIDDGMHGTSRGVRMLIFPGSMLLWPLLFMRYLNSK